MSDIKLPPLSRCPNCKPSIDGRWIEYCSQHKPRN